MPGIWSTNLAMRTSQASSLSAQSPTFSPPSSSPIALPSRRAALIANNDDSLRALRALHPSNHILLLTPTSPQTHEYHYHALIDSLTQIYGISILAMDYTPPPNNNTYVPFDRRHRDALANEACAGVIVVCEFEGEGKKTWIAQEGFARDVAREGLEEVPGVLVQVGGRGRRVEGWGSVVLAQSRREEVLREVAGIIFG